MSTIFFMALQCCQCSTMQVPLSLYTYIYIYIYMFKYTYLLYWQVKQRKNSSKCNKWTCVVCNQKQSIRKVFAQGPMAKDLRLFVQSFNMSRQFPNNTSSDPPPLGEPVEDYKRPRTDWTEYLDTNNEYICQNAAREDRSGE